MEPPASAKREEDVAQLADLPPWRIAPLARLVESPRFNALIASVIVVNALVLAGLTYPDLDPDVKSFLNFFDGVLYAVFLTELVLRMASYGRRPWMFFTSGWNVFDFIVIGSALIPAVRDHATVLRLFRLARLTRIIRVLPGARMLIGTVIRAIPSVGSMLLGTTVLLFIYAMIGWMLFGTELPQEWGTAGTAMLTLFVMLTLETLPDNLYAAQDVTPWANLYFITFVLVAAFIIVNLFIGIVLSAMEEVQDEERSELGRSKAAELETQLQQMQRSLDTLLARPAGQGNAAQGPEPPPPST